MHDPTPGPRRPARTWVFVLCALALVPYFVNLGVPPLWDANEPFYAQRAKEVLEWPQGDFLAPTWNGRPYFAHAPLSTWITVPFYVVFGSTEFGERLPMALAALLTLWATYLLGRRLGGPRVALLAMLILAASPRYWMFCRQLSGDVYLVAILTWAFHLALPAVAGEGGRRPLRAANLLVGVGFLAKGPVILVLYGGSLFLAWCCARPRARLGDLRPLRGLLLILAVGAPWFAYMALRYDGFLGAHFGHYTFGRVLGSIGQRGPHWYLLALLGDAQPWITVLPFAALGAWRRDRRMAALLPLAGIVWTVVFFTLSAGKRNVYMLPIYPLLAVAVAPTALALWDGAHRLAVRIWGLAFAGGGLLAALCLVGLAGNAPLLKPEIWWPVGFLAAAAVPLAWGGWRGNGRWVTGGAIAALLCAQLSVALAFDGLARYRPVPRMATRIREEQDPADPEPAIIYRVAIHSLNFYLDRPTRVAAEPTDLVAKMGGRRRAFVLCPERRLAGLTDALPDAVVEELERGQLLGFRFARAVFGTGRSTRDLLLLRVTLPVDDSRGSRVEPAGEGEEAR